MRRVFCILFSVILVITTMSTYNAKQGIKTTLILDNYEDCNVTDGYVNSITGQSFSYLSSDSNVEVFKTEALSGLKSLRIQNCDMRWWNLSVEDPEIYYYFKARVEENFDNTFLLDLYTQHLPSDNAKDTILSIERVAENIVLKNQEGEEVYTLEPNKVYKIAIKIQRGSSEYEIQVNDKVVSEKNKFFCPIYRITGMRILVTKGTANSFLDFDDFSLMTYGTSYPQLYSYQEPGDMPIIELPKTEEDKHTSVYINTTKINLDAIPVIKNNTLYLPLFRVMECAGLNVKENKGNITVSNDNIKATIGNNKSKLTVNDKTVDLKAPLLKIKGKYMAPLQYFHEVLNCKV